MPQPSHLESEVGWVQSRRRKLSDRLWARGMAGGRRGPFKFGFWESGHSWACPTQHAVAFFPQCPPNLIKGQMYFCDKWG